MICVLSLVVYPVSTVRVILRPVLKIELPRKGQTKENKQNGSTQLTRIKQHSIFTEKSCDQQLAATAREHIHPWQSRETTSLCFQNVDGDVPSEMIKLKGEGGKSLGTVGLIKVSLWLITKYYGLDQLVEGSQLCPVDQPEFLRTTEKRD